MLNNSEKFVIILIPPFLVILSNFYEKKSLQGIEYHMLTTYNYNHYATSIFVEILLLPKMKYMTKTFFLKPQPPYRFPLS